MTDCEIAIEALFNATQSVNATEIASTLCAQFSPAGALPAGGYTGNGNDIVTGLNAQFLVWAGALVFVMHAGKFFSLPRESVAGPLSHPISCH